MSVIKVRDYFKAKGMEDRIIELSESTATVALAALALGTTEGNIAKSISFLVNDEPVLVIAAGNRKIDNKKYKDTFGVKARMIPYELVEEKIGHAPGGVCPFAVNDNVKIYFDESLKEYETIYPAAGSDNSCIKTTPEELATLCENTYGWVNVTKNPE